MFLVGVELKSAAEADIRESLAELGELAVTAGAEIIGDGVQKMDSLAPATFIGKGRRRSSPPIAGSTAWTR